MNDLLPCPFCGPKSDLVFSQPCSDGGFGVTCRHCHTTMDVRSLDRDSVAAAWNARAQPALGEREISEPPFAWRPGQALTVVQTDDPGHWSMDWKPDQIVYFAGWSWDVRKVRADVWVSDQWPPKGPGDLTDGWDPLDLTAALSTTTSTKGAE